LRRALGPCRLWRVSLRWFFFLTRPRPPSPPLFPYTTLFRSSVRPLQGSRPSGHLVVRPTRHLSSTWLRASSLLHRFGRHVDEARSEEHTSELQSRENLVCRLLLEKKKECPRTLSARTLR